MSDQNTGEAGQVPASIGSSPLTRLNQLDLHQSGPTSTSGSMETQTIPTDMLDCFSSDDDGHESSASWGRLFPSGSGFDSFILKKDEYTFGRGEDCDYQFNNYNKKCFQAYSKLHFKLARENTSTGFHVFLTDMSANGTFINGEKVGKGNKQVLNVNDEIAIALKKNKAFIYMDLMCKEDKDLPEAFREKYTMSKLLGRGACGEVKLAFTKGSCKKFAVKIISKKKFSTAGSMSNEQEVMKEVDILKQLKHPCVIKIEDVIDTKDTLYIILELVEGGELFDRVVEIDHFDEQEAKLIFYQMAHAVKYLHDQGITHRDLKPENILLCSDDSNETLIKVTDFGLSKLVDAATVMKTFCGTPNYLAPEILLTAGSGSYTNAIDCWSLGVILFICLVGYPPFSDDRKDMELAKQITGGHYELPKKYWSRVSDEGQDMVKKLLVVDPRKRLTLAEALQHKWLKDESIKNRAHKLMYPTSDGMVPPSLLPKKRKGDGNSQDADLSPKKKI